MTTWEETPFPRPPFAERPHGRRGEESICHLSLPLLFPVRSKHSHRPNGTEGEKLRCLFSRKKGKKTDSENEREKGGKEHSWKGFFGRGERGRERKTKSKGHRRRALRENKNSCSKRDPTPPLFCTGEWVPHPSLAHTERSLFCVLFGRPTTVMRHHSPRRLSTYRKFLKTPDHTWALGGGVKWGAPP